MSVRKENATIIGVGAAACVACCAGPIIGLLAAIGITTAAGVALFGTISLIAGAIALAVVLRRRHRRAALCGTTPATVAVSNQRSATGEGEAVGFRNGERNSRDAMLETQTATRLRRSDIHSSHAS